MLLVRSLGGEDPLEEGMATHSNILAMERSLAGCSPGVCKKSRIPTEQLDNHLIIPVNLNLDLTWHSVHSRCSINGHYHQRPNVMI